METILIESKVCNTCNTAKPASDFRNRRKCKSCENKEGYQRKKIKKETNPEYRKTQNAYHVSYKRKREETIPLEGFKQMIRSSDRRAFGRFGYRSDSKSAQRIGLGWEEFKLYIESKFTDGMSWDNKGEWENDHIIPVSLGDNEDEVEELSHYTNRQPLWAMENKLKSDKIYFHQLTDELITRYKKYIIRYLIKNDMMP
jgi:hypothetical protein